MDAGFFVYTTLRIMVDREQIFVTIFLFHFIANLVNVL